MVDEVNFGYCYMTVKRNLIWTREKGGERWIDG